MASAAFQALFCGAVWISVSAVATALEVNLTDTRQATTDLKWDTYPSDDTGWTEVSGTDENQIPFRTYQVCVARSAEAGLGQSSKQNNWLKTDYIELKEEAKNIFVEIKFTIKSCRNFLGPAAACKETFNLYYLEADSPDSGDDKFMNNEVYKKVDTIAADETIADTETRKIGPLRRKGLYIAFQDTGACMLIYYVRVYYKKCVETVHNLAQFPSTVTGPEVISLVKVTGQCVANAVWSGSAEGPSLLCNSEGEWKLPQGLCQCIPGYAPDKNLSKCIECPAGQYKGSVGNGRCETCPDNSLSTTSSSEECPCSAGYYRTVEDEPSDTCTKPPTAPENVKVIVGKTSVDLQWSPPRDTGGRSDVTYSISCFRCDSTFLHILCSQCGDAVHFEPKSKNLQNTYVTVKQLSANTNYKFRIYSFNGVSQTSQTMATYAEATMSTSREAPSAVRHVRVIEKTRNEVLLNWDRPAQSKSVILNYEVKYTTDGIHGSEFTRFNTKGQTFRIRNLKKNTSYVVQVCARNEAGLGLFSAPLAFRTSGFTDGSETTNDVNVGINIEGNPDVPAHVTPPAHATDNVYLIIGIAVASFLVVVIIAALMFVMRLKRRNEKFSTPTEVFPFVNNTIDIIHSQSEHRTYVDPSTYGDPDIAVHQFAKEIDSFNIKREGFLGSGEFGDVYKGVLRPVTPPSDDGAMYLTASFPSSNYVVAIKTLKAGYSEKEKEDFLTEASIMGQFDHANVIKLEGVVTRATPLMIVTEYMENGSLDTFLESRHIRGIDVDVSQLVRMLRDVANGMDYLSKMKFVHRDLAARNVLVNGQLVCKVSDFGLSRVLQNIEDDDTAIYTTKGGLIPVRWTAPEAITMRTFTSSSDVWSFGIVTWEILTHGDRPYWEMFNADVIHCVQCGYRLPPPSFCPRVLHNLMMNCWNLDRTRRPTFRQIVAQLDSMLVSSNKLRDTINNIPVHEQPLRIPETLDLSSLGQWLEDMNMTQYKEIMMRHGCVTAEQITSLCSSHFNEMGITDVTAQQVLLEGVERLRLMMEEISPAGNGGTTV